MQIRKYKRRNYFIKKEMQGRYIFSYFLIVVGGSLLFALILGLYSSDTMTITYEDYTLQLGVTPLVLLQRFLTAHWLFLVIGGALLVVISMFLTHRVAGPLHKLEQYVGSMLQGNLGRPLVLRNHDEGKELAAMICELSGELARTISELKSINEEIEADIVHSDSCPHCRKIERRYRAIRDKLDRFAIDDHTKKLNDEADC